MVDQVVALYQHVAEIDDLPVVANAGSGIRVVLHKPIDRLADDLEVALDGLPSIRSR
jgi:hypothetical protein